ncbi:DUF4148 domain-containing protein [Caballeronia sp. LP006]|jgi:hypothetical protein|uniref:DUF4148 domain-containing protein n=1 Tax=unclassified Caballeronia TaxID=2646786 RepID=UPI001FD1E11A|nr:MULTISPECIES: DUF4148 domain-containing protein [unclassified Caballeronia]MDR5828362.1 DUF4148 domain-containing protein [Caballeronia sp. LP006]
MASKFRLSHLILFATVASCAASALAQPVTPIGDPSAPKTRAQVKQEFLAWRAAGYDPNDWLNYPDNAMRAGQIVSQQRQAQRATGAN